MESTVAIAQAPSIDPVSFEQPLSERMRTFLRLEFLYRQAMFHAGEPTDFGTRAAVGSLLEILTIVGRGDIRAEVIKDLDRHLETLGHYRRTPGVDADRLTTLMGNIDTLRGQLAVAGNRFMTGLRESDFLNTIKHRSVIPGGTCTFDLPDYGYWLRRPARERAQQLAEWLDQLKPLCEAVSELLWLTRESGEARRCVAVGGLYQRNLSRNEQFNLVRVLVPATAGLYPEISAGQHRFTVRFASWRGVHERPRPVAEDVAFDLALCP